MIRIARTVRWMDLGALALSGVTLGLFGSCNFDSAYERYCANNPRCADTSAGPEVRAEVGPDVAPDLGPDMRPDLGPDVPPGPDRDGSTGPPSFVQISPCLSDSDCGSSGKVLCHPSGKVCMFTCRDKTDCPPWLDSCRDLPQSGGSRTQRVCTCSGNGICAQGIGSTYTYLCNSIDNLCEPSCSTSSECGMFRLPRVCGTDLVCVPACFSSSGCPSASQPRCDPAKGCAGCMDDSDCANRGDGLSQCNSSGSCVAPMSSP
jgi:hypothetical protein